MTAEISESLVWSRHEDDAFCRAIPTVAITPSGTLLAFSEARHADEHHVDEGRMYDEIPSSITMKRSRDLGATWSDTTFIERADGSWWREPGRRECWSQATCVVSAPIGKLFVFYVLNQGAVRDVNTQRFSRVFFRTSCDGGDTWSERREITDVLSCTVDCEPGPASMSAEGYPSDHMGRAFHICCGHGISVSRNNFHPASDENDRLIVPFWSRRAVTHNPVHRGYGVKPIFSDDGGETWKVLAQFGYEHYLTEHRLVCLPDGSLYMNARSDHPKSSQFRFVSRSSDFGRSWAPPEIDAGIPPSYVCDAGLDSIGSVIALSKGAARGARADMTLYRSSDGGRTWHDRLRICKGPTYYSDVVSMPDGSFGVLYTRGRLNRYRGSDIVFARVFAR